jgi:FkbH-like protein
VARPDDDERIAEGFDRPRDANRHVGSGRDRVKLAEALRILNAAPAESGGTAVFGLACSFTPLHLRTLLAAHLQQRRPDRKVEVTTGLYGDLLGTLDRMAGAEAVAVVLEWTDLDPRLGLRDLGGWRPDDVRDIVADAEQRVAALGTALVSLAYRVPIVVALPGLPIPPVGHTPGWLLARIGAELRRLVAELASALVGGSRVRLLDPQRLDTLSPAATRMDVKSYLTTGFPYRMPHADTLAGLLTGLLLPPAAMKGVITDLDDTLWCGILGEEGPNGVFWDLDHHAQGHGLYQQLLAALASSGVLVAVASKADPRVVDQGLAVPNLLVGRDALYPVEASWGAKSDAVRRILAAWNIGPDSVVFVDDSATELAEVKAVFPEIECLQFPVGDDGATYALLERLRDLCGKERISDEDGLRLASVKSNVVAQAPLTESPARQDAFLTAAGQELTCLPVAGDTRPLELVNKTNQFNLNGRRWSESEWSHLLARENALAVCFAYRDKYGLLGKIAVIAGCREGTTLHVRAWVLSCRAFSRRIEYGTLSFLFEHWNLDEIVFDYRATPRSQLVADFFATLIESAPSATTRLTRAAFTTRCPTLYFHVVSEAI